MPGFFVTARYNLFLTFFFDRKGEIVVLFQEKKDKNCKKRNTFFNRSILS